MEPSNIQQDFCSKMNSDALAFVDFFNARFNNHLDFSEESLQTVDAILEEVGDFYEAIAEERIEEIIVGCSAYIFEVARKHYGGTYFWYEQRNQPILVTGMPNFEIALLVYDKVKGRIENGAEDNIPFFFDGYAQAIKTAKPGEKKTYV